MGITGLVITALVVAIPFFIRFILVDDVYHCPYANAFCLVGVAPVQSRSGEVRTITQTTFEFLFPVLRSLSRVSFDYLFPELSEKCEVYREIERRYSLNPGGRFCSEKLWNLWRSVIACEIGSQFEEPVDRDAIGFHLLCDSRIEKILGIFKDCEELQY